MDNYTHAQVAAAVNDVALPEGVRQMLVAFVEENDALRRVGDALEVMITECRAQKTCASQARLG